MTLNPRLVPDLKPPLQPTFGRRHGHRLRDGRRDLIETLLPRMAVPVPDAGEVLDPAAFFTGDVRDIWLEIGFGAGEHLANQAQGHPDIGFIGAEPFINGVASLLDRINKDNISNIRILDDDIRPLFGHLPDGCLGRVFILFPDPWPKRRHHKRRLIAPDTLNELARLMKSGAELRFASDHMGYVRWVLDHFSRHPSFEWTARRPSDWRTRPPGSAPTRYEKKAIAQGRPPAYLTFRRRPGD